MNTQWTPLHLKLLLQVYTLAEPGPNCGGCEAEYEGHLADAGLIELYGDSNCKVWVCTDKGKAHVQQLLSLKIPTQAWISASGELLRL